jgi:hypothetical protein
MPATGSTKCSVPATTFLSRPHGVDHLLRRQVGDRRQRAQLRDERGERSRTSAGAPRADARARRRQHAVGDRLAVPEAAVAGHRLERVAGRVAEVEDAPAPLSRSSRRRRRPP